MLTQSGDPAQRDNIRLGIAYWDAVSTIVNESHVGINIDTYIPIAQKRREGIVAIPNEAVSNPPKQ